jgi:HKD family nuclease
MIRLVDSGWAKELTEALRSDTSELKIICPFIKTTALDRLLSRHPKSIRVITRFNLGDFAEGVSDIEALRNLLAAGAEVRGVRNLHAKLYLFGKGRAIVTSANLTEAAINRNHEFGMVADDKTIIAACETYFDELWRRGGVNLTPDQIDAWNESVTYHRASGGRPNQGAGLGDFGADAGISQPPPMSLPTVVADAQQAFVKFLGEGDNRVAQTFATVEVIKRAGCHWAVAYPASKRPSGVKEDAVIFIARLTRDPYDIRIFGRAIGMKYMPGRDDATERDIALRPWKNKWPRYIRVYHAEFVAGDIGNGVSLNELMGTLGADAFLPTQRNKERGKGNTDPRKAYRQQAAVQLSPEGLSWVSERLQASFDEHGKVPKDTMDGLDWPDPPVAPVRQDGDVNGQR